VTIVNAKWVIILAILWRDQVTFDEMMMMFALY